MGVRHPEHADKLCTVLQLTDGAVATSARYERGDHILDGRTGRPATGLLSLTVVASSLTIADTTATAAFAMGAAGVEWASDRPGCEVFAVDAERRVLRTPGFPVAPHGVAGGVDAVTPRRHRDDAAGRRRAGCRPTRPASSARRLELGRDGYIPGNGIRLPGARDALSGGNMRRAAIVFVHGLFSSSATWRDLKAQLSGTPGIAQDFDLLFFDYATPRLSWNPLRKMPNIDTVAESLKSYLADQPISHERLVIVTHSQGGLVVQRFLSRMLAEGRGWELARIRRVVMFACPNNGSELFLLLRRGLMGVTRNSQERELRPLQASVQETQRRVMTGVVHAQYVSRDRCPIPVVSYA